MSDIEMTRLCAEAMGYPEYVNPDTRAPIPTAPCILVLKMDENATRELYNPLHNDAQAMALVKKYGMKILRDENLNWSARIEDRNSQRLISGAYRYPDLNRAIVECVAQIKPRVKGRTP